MPPLGGQSAKVEWPVKRESRVSWQDLVTVVIFFRLYHVVRFAYSQSRYFQPKCHFFMYLSHRRNVGVYSSPKFIIQAHMTRSPYQTILIVSVAIMLFSGLLFHMVERSADAHLLVYDGPWFIAVTQLTVGYGDILPRTDLGRLFAMGPGLCAILTMSLVMTYSLIFLGMTRRQKIVASKLSHDAYYRSKLSTLTATFLQRWWRLKLSRRQKFDSTRLKRLLDYKSAHELFKQKFAINLGQATPELDVTIMTMQRHCDQAFKDIKKKFEKLPDYSTLAGSFSTHKFNIVAKILIIKQAYLRFKLIGRKNNTGRPRERRSMPPLRRKNKRSSIVEKKASDMAMKKMKVRLSIIPSAESLDSIPSDPDTLLRRCRRTSLQ
jgi:hypothetical protein